MTSIARRRSKSPTLQRTTRSISGILRALELQISFCDRIHERNAGHSRAISTELDVYNCALSHVLQLAFLIAGRRRALVEPNCDAERSLIKHLDGVAPVLRESVEQFVAEECDGDVDRDIERIARLYETLRDYTAHRTSSGSIRIAATRGRRRTGTHYTPSALAAALVRSALAPFVYSHTNGIGRRTLRSEQGLLAIRICDPACGSGVLLVEACRYVADCLVKSWKNKSHRTPLPKRQDACIRLARRLIAQHCLYGVDKDPLAVELTKRSLGLFAGGADQPASILDQHIRCGDALIGTSPGKTTRDTAGLRAHAFHWSQEFPEVFANGSRFDAVLANPPWGQKAVGHSPAVKRYIRRRFPSTAGIYDLCRPFIERGVQLLADGGMIGMVLPDILLLKDYPHTRKFLLDNLTIQSIDWWGQAFAAASIDAITLVGTRAPAPTDHQVQVHIHRPDSTTHRILAQASFWENPKFAFNLYITSSAQHVLNHLRRLPTVGDFFEIHEGVHSGNIRSTLFVQQQLDGTCREIYFGREEIRPYALEWHGRYVRLGALPAHNTKTRYANAGRSHWFAQPKILVRRTGDYVLAAPDFSGRYASNNFFVVFPKSPCALDLYGLCALLNSRFMTWFFRTIEPRQGRLFAELKIKHLCRFPLPLRVTSPQACKRLNELGKRRAKIESVAAKSPRREQERLRLDRAIEKSVTHLLGVDDLLPASL
jgi:hypothetical protein